MCLVAANEVHGKICHSGRSFPKYTVENWRKNIFEARIHINLWISITAALNADVTPAMGFCTHTFYSRFLEGTDERVRMRRYAHTHARTLSKIHITISLPFKVQGRRHKMLCISHNLPKALRFCNGKTKYLCKNVKRHIDTHIQTHLHRHITQMCNKINTFFHVKTPQFSFSFGCWQKHQL